MLDRDAALAADGYKTIAISRQVLPDGPMEFVGILPMMDPVREDTAITIQRLSNCGISVKVCGRECCLPLTTVCPTQLTRKGRDLHLRCR
jgi:hypothetical protein